MNNSWTWIFYAIICSISFTLQSVTQILLPIPSSQLSLLLSWKPWDGNQLYISNFQTHIVYDFDSESQVKSLSSGTLVAGGSLYPLVFQTQDLGLNIIYLSDSKIYSKQELGSDINKSITYLNNFNIALHDETSFLVAIFNTNYCWINQFAISDLKTLKTLTRRLCNQLYIYSLKNKQIVVFIYNTDQDSAIFEIWSVSLVLLKDTAYNNYTNGDGLGSFHLIELDSSEIWWGCRLDKNYVKLSCFSAVIDNENKVNSITTKTVISSCSSVHQNKVISWAPFRDKYAIAACGGKSLKIKVIDTEIETMSDEIILNDSQYFFYDFTVLSTDKIVIAGIQFISPSTSFYSYVYEFDKCPADNEKTILLSDTLAFASFCKFQSIIVFTSSNPNESFNYNWNQDYDCEYVTYQPIKSVDWNITFDIYNKDIFGFRVISDGKCTLNIVVCYDSCDSCSEAGDISDHHCDNCLSNFYPIEDNLSNCYDENTKPSNTFLSSDQYEYCDVSCLTCENTRSKCLTCANGYAMVFDQAGSCWEYDNPPPMYYWTSDKAYFKRCYESCASCWVEGFINDNNCESCVTSYYFAEDLGKMCFNDKPSNDYFFDSALQQYSLCNTSCAECVDNADKCWSCKTGFYWFNNSCLTLSEKPSNTYVNESDKKFELCYERCATCSMGDNLDAHHCDTCWSDYFFLENTNCVTTVPDNYYHDAINDVYRECNTRCSKCSGNADNCSECNDGFYLLSVTFQCLSLAEKPGDYYVTSDNKHFEQCYTECNSCSEGGTTANHNCDSCKTGLFLIEGMGKNCLSAPSDTNYYWDTTDNTYKKCYTSCKECNTSGDINNHNCISCLDGYDFISPANCKIWSESYQCNDWTISVINGDDYLLDFEESGTYITPSISLDINAHLRFSTSSSALPFNGSIKSMETNMDIAVDMPWTTRRFKFIPNNIKEISEISYTVVDQSNSLWSSTCTLTFITCETNCKECSTTDFCTTCLDTHYIFKENINSVDMKCVSDCGQNYLYAPLKTCLHNCPNKIYKKECVDVCPVNTYSNVDNRCIDNTLTPCVGTSNCYDSTETKEEIAENLDDNILWYKDLNSTILGNDFIFGIILTNNTNSNINTSWIYLWECEIILKAYYKIQSDLPLIIAKIDIIWGISLTNKVEYGVYDLSGQRLDWKYCKNIDIEIEYPIVNKSEIDVESGKKYSDWGVDVFDSSDKFFNDICVPYDLDGKDMIIWDRRNDLYQNVTFCEKDCVYNGGDYPTNEDNTSMIVKCLCPVKEEINVESEVLPLKNSDVFTNSISATNILVAKCFHLFGDWSNLKNNFGFWFTLITMGIQMTILIGFQYWNYCSFFLKLNQNCQKTFLLNQELKACPVHRSRTHYSETMKITRPDDKKRKAFYERKSTTGSHLSTRIQQPWRDSSNLKWSDSLKTSNILTMNTDASLALKKNYCPSKFQREQSLNSEPRKTREEKILFEVDIPVREFIIEEWRRTDNIDNSPYEIAEKEDTRQFYKIFWGWFREKEIICNTFFPIELFEMVAVNICYFWFTIILSFMINALFYTDDKISARYHNELSFISNLLQTIYSSLLSFIISKTVFSLIKYCPLLETIFKEVHYMDKLYYLIGRVWKQVKRKIFIFYVMIIIWGGCFWYYLTLFCIVYKGSQVEWFKNGWTSFLVDFATSFGICFAWSFIRALALSWKSKSAYNVSNYWKQLF